MKDSKIGYGILAVFAGLLLTGIGCTNYQIPGSGNGGEIKANSCEGCHTDYDRLVEVHTPDAEAVTFYGTEVPHYEPYDRVYLGGEGYDAFKTSGHYGIGCTGCHNGNGNTGDKNEAHSGDWIKSPSLAHQEKCATCHESLSNNFMTSLHSGTGLKRSVSLRAGLAGAEEFDQLPAHQLEAYDQKCATCHGTCGTCHIVRPDIAGGGLSDGHNFTKTPDSDNVCASCHAFGAGHAFLGESPEADPDLHHDQGFDCLSCHDGHEVHGDGQPVDQRYAYTELPNCEDCHSGLEQENLYHTMHYDDFQCQICHSQDYNNCGACHIKDGIPEIEAYMDYKIALNPISDLRNYEFALVRRTPAHPENWVGYGADLEYSNFDVLPTYNYATPHNIQRHTPRTNVEEGQSCSFNCHIRNEGGTLINAENFLWADSLETWEVDATSAYTVDGQLPGSWFIER